jgi:hypothetical protein
MVVTETNIYFYLVVIFFFVVINDIISTPYPGLKKFLLIILSSIIFQYIAMMLIEHYFKDQSFSKRFKKMLISAFIVFIITVINVYFVIYKARDSNNIDLNLFNSFNFAIHKNFIFLVFLLLYTICYFCCFYFLDRNSKFTDIICPSALGAKLILLLFIIIIYIGVKQKLINRQEKLNSFISLFAIFVFLLLMYIYTLMGSMSSVCEQPATEESNTNNNSQQRINILLFIGIIIILWLDDTRNWHQYGSIIFIIVTIFGLYCTFYYSQIYPSTGLFSIWIFVEWLILIFYRKENSKNSLHYSFMNI